MKKKIISAIEDALFALHPQVKSFYTIISLIKELPITEQDFTPTPVTQPIVESGIMSSSDIAVSRLPKVVPNSSDNNLQTRVLNIIKELDRFVRVSEIVSKIKEYDPDFSATLSPVLTHLRQIGVLKNHMPTGNRKITYWGLTEWELEGVN